MACHRFRTKSFLPSVLMGTYILANFQIKYREHDHNTAMTADYTPILVSGAPRSGTTFLGKMLGLPRHVFYIDEPLNPDGGIMGVDVPFVYIDETTPKLEAKFDAMMYELMIGQGNFKSSTSRPTAVTSVKGLARHILNSRTHIQYKLDARNPVKNRFLIKDPTACFASEYFHQKIGMNIVMCVRHPGATIASYKRLGWHYSLQDLVGQDALMRRSLSKVLGGLDLSNLTVVQEWAYFWLAIYTVIDEYLANNAAMLMVRHEDLSVDPLRYLSKLYAQLGLEFTPNIQRTILAHTKAGNPVDAPNNVAHALKRDSAGAVNRWKEFLTKDEVREIRRITEPVADKYYADFEW
jgi:hypothetical protein